MKRRILILLSALVLLLSACTPMADVGAETSGTRESVTTAPQKDPTTETTDDIVGGDKPTPTPTPGVDDGFPNDPEPDGTKRY